MASALSSEKIIKLLKSDIKKEISDLTVAHHILTEDDLQYALYSAILSRIRNSRYYQFWKVFNRLYVSDASKYPDLTLFKARKKEIIIELKHEVMRGVNTNDIVEDVIKLASFRDNQFPEAKFISLTTMWDPDGSKQEELKKRIQADSHLSSIEVIVYEISQFVPSEEHYEWQKDHIEYNKERCS